MKLQDLIPDIRGILRDPVREGKTPFFANLTILRGIIDGYRALCSSRPEARYIDGRLTDLEFPEAEADLIVFDMNIDVRWRLGIVYFAVARCYETGVNDSVNAQLAANYKQQANQEFAL